MPFEALTPADRSLVHGGALQILEEVGLQVPSLSLRTRLRDAGLAATDGSDRVRLSRTDVESALARAPRVVGLGARGEGRSLVLDGSRTYAATDGCAAKTVDFDTGARRPSTLADVAASARLADALQQFDVYWMMVSAQDVPRSSRVPLEYLTALRNTGKHVQMIDVARREEAEALRRMAGALADAGVVEGPAVSALIAVVSPLRLDPAGVEAALAFAAAGLPVVACSMPIAGVTAPATVAGHLVLAHAESLGLVTVLQTLCPGAPVIYCSFAAFADPRTGATSYADPRAEWTAAAVAQLGRSLSLPCFTSGRLLAMSAGPDLVSGGGLLETSTLLAYEQLVVDDEALRDRRLAAAAPELSPETLALEVIAKVGPGGHFLAQKHTARHMRGFVLPRFADPSAARQEARRLLEAHTLPPLAASVEAALDRIVQESAAAVAG